MPEGASHCRQHRTLQGAHAGVSERSLVLPHGPPSLQGLCPAQRGVHQRVRCGAWLGMGMPSPTLQQPAVWPTHKGPCRPPPHKQKEMCARHEPARKNTRAQHALIKHISQYACLCRPQVWPRVPRPGLGDVSEPRPPAKQPGEPLRARWGHEDYYAVPTMQRSTRHTQPLLTHCAPRVLHGDCRSSTTTTWAKIRSLSR